MCSLEYVSSGVKQKTFLKDNIKQTKNTCVPKFLLLFLSFHKLNLPQMLQIVLMQQKLNKTKKEKLYFSLENIFEENLENIII